MNVRWLFWILIVVAPAAFAQVIPAEVVSQLRKAKIPLEAISLSVKTLEPVPRTRLAYREQEPRNPASVMKLVTTFAALDQLGPSHTWKTRFFVDGLIEGGTLKGNLIIKGGGDPKWVIERISADLAALKEKGLHTIQGDLVLDNTLFNLPPKLPGDFDGEGLRPYNATPDALLVNFKSLTYTFAPDEATRTTTITVEPPIADLTLDNRLRWAPGACGDWRSDLQADFQQPDTVHFEGLYKPSCGERTLTVAYARPDTFAAQVLMAMLAPAGLALRGSVRYGLTPPNARLLHEAASLPLKMIIADVNKFSNNVMAQHLLLTLPIQTQGHATPALAQEALQTWWRMTLPKSAPPTIENGSGLSRQESISTAALAALLQKAAQHTYKDIYEQSLAVAGVEGTVRNIGHKKGMEAIVGNASLKTGTLKDVTAIAGYVTTLSHERFVVVAIVNHPEAIRARPALEALLAWVVAGAPEARKAGK